LAFDLRFCIAIPPNAEVSDGGGHQAPGFANRRRPPPFAPLESQASQISYGASYKPENHGNAKQYEKGQKKAGDDSVEPTRTAQTGHRKH
jgi:hypothetical protein